MSSKSGPRKRAYRSHRAKCNECQAEMNADHANTHVKNVHGGKKMRFTPLVDVSQSQLRRFLVSTNATLAEPSSSETSCSNATDSSMFTDIGASDESQPGLSYSNTAPGMVVELGAAKPPDLEMVSHDEVPKPTFSDGTSELEYLKEVRNFQSLCL